MKYIAYNLIACGVLMFIAHWLAGVSGDKNGLIMFFAGGLYQAITKPKHR